jgi:hypothetical protein
MTPISALIAAIVARVLDRRRCDAAATSQPPVPEDPELARMADAWREPEAGG